MKRLLLTGALTTLMASSAFAAINFSKMKTTTFPSIDVQKVHKQDVLNEKLGNAPRFAIVHDVHINPMASSDWTTEGDNLVWRHSIKATSAASINIAFETFELSNNAQLNFYSADQKNCYQTFYS